MRSRSAAQHCPGKQGNDVILRALCACSDGVATGIWASSVLSNYISVSQGDDDSSNERVGIAQAVQGTFLVAAAIPGTPAMQCRRLLLRE